ncbi:MAG: Maf family protein [Lysobacterales bacterium]|nr:septum formation inhibitor Maf [Xanthomonadales bacterium]MCB1610987.1 septum formation inhibitor Maf [Xanthomonadales bacterium]MCP5473803.1 septum formation inhibitor Maf [Rhodanobacteraceae bacterium]
MSSSLILASASPRRLELLRQIGIEPRVCAVDIVECQTELESAAEYSRRIARDKAVAGRALCADNVDNWVLGADTEVVVDGLPLGKPQDPEDALRMLRLLSGREHQVLSSVALIGPHFDEVMLQSTSVRMARIAAAEMQAYVESGEPFGKAGAYAIQGRAACFIASIAGSYSGVMGLPLFETATLLRRVGLI